MKLRKGAGELRKDRIHNQPGKKKRRERRLQRGNSVMKDEINK